MATRKFKIPYVLAFLWALPVSFLEKGLARPHLAALVWPASAPGGVAWRMPGTVAESRGVSVAGRWPCFVQMCSLWFSARASPRRPLSSQVLLPHQSLAVHRAVFALFLPLLENSHLSPLYRGGGISLATSKACSVRTLAGTEVEECTVILSWVQADSDLCGTFCRVHTLRGSIGSPLKPLTPQHPVVEEAHQACWDHIHVAGPLLPALWRAGAGSYSGDG